MRVTKGKRALALALCAPLMLIPVGCAGTGSTTTVTVTAVATDISTIASGLAGAFATIPGVPPAVTTALADLSKAAASFQSASSAGQVSVVQQVETDVNTLVKAAGSIPGLPAQVTVALTAAQVLLPVIEAAVNMVVTTAAPVNAMSPDVARLVLKADAQLKPAASK